MVVDCNTVAETVTAKNTYTYSPFGNPYTGELSETVYNPFQFTGQWLDVEIDQYYLRARMYDPTMMRFTTRDPIRGEQNEPLTLHKYLYCVNDPIDRIDPRGEISAMAARLTNAVVTGYSFYGHGISLAAYSVDTGDDRFWNLAEFTFDFMPLAMTLAAINPNGPVTNILTSIALGVIEVGPDDYHPGSPLIGSVTGFTWRSAPAIDVLAYGVYLIGMAITEVEMGVDHNDIDDFKEWLWR